MASTVYYGLSAHQERRLATAIAVCFASPFIDDLEDFIWEAAFHYVKGLPVPNPLVEGRTKRLFDAVDQAKHIGWSLKAVQWGNLAAGTQFELVIQRADIFKKAVALGFAKLDATSPPEDLGRALIRHWNEKVVGDGKYQGVTDARVGILLKDNARKNFVLVESSYPPFNEEAFAWKWTNATATGLQGFSDGRLKLRWYPNQKQLFEVFHIPDQATRVSISPARIDADEFVEAVMGLLSPKDAPVARAVEDEVPAKVVRPAAFKK